MVFFDRFRIRERRGGIPTLGTRSRVDFQGRKPVSCRPIIPRHPQILRRSQTERRSLAHSGRDRRRSPHSHECGPVEAFPVHIDGQAVASISALSRVRPR